MKFIEALAYSYTDRETAGRTFLYGFGLFLALGIPTALLSNPLIPYVRMIPATFLDYVFLFTTSQLAAVYLSLPESKVCKPNAALAGGFLGFLAFFCPICNKLLVLLLGFSFMYTIINPIRPLLGVASILILLYAIGSKWSISSHKFATEQKRQNKI